MIPSGYSRNVVKGTLPGSEIFEISFWTDEAPADQGATQTQADNFAGEWSTAMANTGSPKGFLPVGGSFDELTVYSYLDNTGKASHIGQTAIAGGAGTTAQIMPDQCALVATLQTGFAGRRNRGRMYFPYLAVGLSGGQVPSSNVDNFATWLSNLITALNSHLGGQHVCVLSQVAGTSHSVSAIKVDSKVDIQRRRADKVVPTHTSTVTVT